MKTQSITLGGRAYNIQERPMRGNREWRDQLTAVIRPVSDFVNKATTGAILLPESVEEIRRDPSILASMGGALQEATGLLFGGIDKVLDLTISYSPELEGDRAWLESNAYDSEVFAAFVAVLNLAYPLAGVIQRVARLGSPPEQNSLN